MPFYAKPDFFTRPLNRSGIATMLAGIERSWTRRMGPGASRSMRSARGEQGEAGAMGVVLRDALFLAQYYTAWAWPSTATGRANQLKWITAFHNSMRPFASGQGYQS